LNHEEVVERELVSFSLEQAARAARLALAGTVVIGFIAFVGVGPIMAGTWVALTLAVLLGRNRVLILATARLSASAEPQPARRALSLSSLALALVLGALPAVTFARVDTELRFLLTLFFCCWCAAGMSSLGIVPRLYAGYLVLVLGGLVLGWLSALHAQALPIGIGIALYGLVLHVFSRGFAKRIADGIAIRTENTELVRKLSAANAAKTNFIMAASHDLRQPLHAIAMLGGVLARATDPADIDQARGALTSALNGLHGLFSAILDLSRLDSGNVRLHPAPVAVHDLVARLDLEYRALCLESGRRWECHSEQAWAYTDPVLLERVLRNLLDNAVKHAGQGNVRLSLTAEPAIALCVSDTGPGIPLEEQSRVFEEFYRGAGAAASGGLGLGLSIVKRLTDLLGYALDVGFTHPHERIGASFSIGMPSMPDAALIAASSADPAPPPPDVAGLNLLVVDDEQAVLDATRALLLQWSCKTRTCRTSEELAVVLSDDWRPDVVLVDYRFEPQASGLDAIAALRNRYPDMGVVVVTGESDAAVLARLAESGLPVLEKPVDPSELRMTLGLFKSVD